MVRRVEVAGFAAAAVGRLDGAVAGSVAVDEAPGLEPEAPPVAVGAIVPESEGLTAEELEPAPVVSVPAPVEAESEPLLDAVAEAVAVSEAEAVTVVVVDAFETEDEGEGVADADGVSEGVAEAVGSEVLVGEGVL